jgi:hypothetical protein
MCFTNHLRATSRGAAGAFVVLLAFVIGLLSVTRAHAQVTYRAPVPNGLQAASAVPARPVYPQRVYAFKDEPLMSINNSYLGYGNLVYVGPNPPSPGYVTRYGQMQSAGVVRTPGPVPQRRGFRLFGRRR